MEGIIPGRAQELIVNFIIKGLIEMVSHSAAVWKVRKKHCGITEKCRNLFPTEGKRVALMEFRECARKVLLLPRMLLFD